MPRKTHRGAADRDAGVDASMRPRPDAAENLWTATAAAGQTLSLQ